jgi:hypothetical protein
LETSQFSYDLINDEIFSTLNEKFESTVISETLNSGTKQCIFNPFVKIFNSTYYFPSRFISVEFNKDKVFNISEYIYSKQFVILDNNSILFTQYVNNTELLKHDLNAIITEYLSTII